MKRWSRSRAAADHRQKPVIPGTPDVKGQIEFGQEKGEAVMLKCDRCENLIMRFFDHDLSGQEREDLDQHLDSCSNCRLLFSQLNGIVDTLENMEPAKPEPHLERLVMDRIMSLPACPHNNGQYRLARMVYGLSAGIIALLLLVISLAIQDSGSLDLILAGRQYLDVLSGFMVDLQIVYQIVASLFPSEIFSLFLGVQFISIFAVFMLVLVTLRTVFGGQTRGHLDAS
jgi:hypothetical protein